MILWKIRRYVRRKIIGLLLNIPFVCRLVILQLEKRTPEFDRESHMYLTGKTGSGKSSYLEMLINGIRYKSRKKEDVAIVVLDPHGDMVERIIQFKLVNINPKRVVYVDPFLKKGYTPCLNPLEMFDATKEKVELATQHLVKVFEELIPDTRLSNYMRAILKPCLATLLALNTCSLVDLQNFMSKSKCERRINEGKRSRITSHKQFFKCEFENGLYDGTKGSVYTKLQSLLNSEVFYNMTSGVSTIDLEDCVNKGKVILFNLSKGKMGEEVSETIGRLIIARLKSIAISRAKLHPNMRKKIYLVIDEADSYMGGDSLNVILKEARKYGLHLILCTQNLVSGRDQEKLKRNLLNNTNVKTIGSNGLSTLHPLSKEVNIPIDKLLKTMKHEFRIKSGDKKPKKIRPRNALGKHSPLLISKKRVRAQKHMLFKQGYYKPIVTEKDELKRIQDLPIDRRRAEIESATPKPRFSI